MRRVLTLTALLWFVTGAAPAFAVEATDYFTDQQIEASTAFRGRAYFLSFAGLIVGTAVLAFLGLGRGSRSLARWSRGTKRRTVRVIKLVLAVTLIPAIVVLPFTLGRHAHSRGYGLATNTAGEFLRDLVTAIGFEAAVLAVACLVVLGLARRLPRAWPAVAAPVGAGLTIFLVMIFPVVVEPAFNTFTPADAETTARVEEVAARMSLDVDEVLIADASRRTTALNAYVSGLGATRRVVLFDTLLAEAPPEEIDAVVAHELAHALNSDVLVGTMIGAGGVALSIIVLWLLLGRARLRRWLGAEEGPGDPALVPFVALFLTAALLITAPIANAWSRGIEAEADRVALSVIDEPDAMIGLQVRLAVENLSDLSPNPVIEWWFFSHPPTLDRIAAAEAAR